MQGSILHCLCLQSSRKQVVFTDICSSNSKELAIPQFFNVALQSRVHCRIEGAAVQVLIPEHMDSCDKKKQKECEMTLR